MKKLRIKVTYKKIPQKFKGSGREAHYPTLRVLMKANSLSEVPEKPGFRFVGWVRV